jgi:uncharacterized small protein (DUF1192 family)
MFNTRPGDCLKAKIGRLEAEIARVEAGEAPRRVESDTWKVRQAAIWQRRQERKQKSWAVLLLFPYSPILTTIRFWSLLSKRRNRALAANAVYLVALKDKLAQLQTEVDRFEGRRSGQRRSR